MHREGRSDLGIAVGWGRFRSRTALGHRKPPGLLGALAPSATSRRGIGLRLQCHATSERSVEEPQALDSNAGFLLQDLQLFFFLFALDLCVLWYAHVAEF